MLRVLLPSLRPFPLTDAYPAYAPVRLSRFQICSAAGLNAPGPPARIETGRVSRARGGGLPPSDRFRPRALRACSEPRGALRAPLHYARPVQLEYSDPARSAIKLWGDEVDGEGGGGWGEGWGVPLDPSGAQLTNRTDLPEAGVEGKFQVRQRRAKFELLLTVFLRRAFGFCSLNAIL